MKNDFFEKANKMKKSQIAKYEVNKLLMPVISKQLFFGLGFCIHFESNGISEKTHLARYSICFEFPVFIKSAL